MKRSSMHVLMAGAAAWSLSGCGHSQPASAPMAPPVAQYAPTSQPMNGGMGQMGGMGGGMNGNMGGGMNGGMNGNMGGGGTMPVSAQSGGVYNWQDVPVGQQVGIAQAQFDQGGYQLVTDSGDTIVVPFANQNLYVMRFGRSGGQNYFVNEGGVPTLYLAPGAGLANANAQGALWYPLPNNFNYTRPVYVGLAPTWNDYVGMGWYPGMAMYGGMWGYNPYRYSMMPGFYVNIGGSPYYGWGGYHTYYSSHPGYYRPSVVYRNYNTPMRGAGSYRYSGSYRSSGSYGSTGSYRPGSGTGSYRPSGMGGSFSRPSGSFNSGSYRPSSGGFSRPSGTFGGASSGGSFGGSRPGGAFGGSSGSFGGSRPAGSFGGASTSTPRGSFGGGSSGYSAPARPSGGSSFGGGSFSRPSGGSSFGGGRSSGGSFGGGRRR